MLVLRFVATSPNGASKKLEDAPMAGRAVRDSEPGHGRQEKRRAAADELCRLLAELWQKVRKMAKKLQGTGTWRKMV